MYLASVESEYTFWHVLIRIVLRSFDRSVDENVDGDERDAAEKLRGDTEYNWSKTVY